MGQNDRSAWTRRAGLSALAVIVFAPFGALTHEAGHYLTARSYGTRPTLHFASVDFGLEDHPVRVEHRQMSARIRVETTADGELRSDRSSLTEAEWDRMEALTLEVNRMTRNVTVMGPVQNLVWGSMGALLVVAGRRGDETLPWWSWVGATIASMLARPLLMVVRVLWAGGGTSDEVKVAYFAGLDLYVLLLAEAAFAGVVLLGMVACMPSRERMPWVAGTSVGGFVGMALWHNVFGPLWLP